MTLSKKFKSKIATSNVGGYFSKLFMKGLKVTVKK